MTTRHDRRKKYDTIWTESTVKVMKLTNFEVAEDTLRGQKREIKEEEEEEEEGRKKKRSSVVALLFRLPQCLRLCLAWMMVVVVVVVA
ncbi:hypothetical protein E2C01_032192 [Portunus trituberculatus]|uniref:Uncharacterized protein n=1 Tax=Portunus trituberculatus TaxID=210409 RepID=A0A5B7EWV8_PORTR|nr:hypothetical protein [Portunus trituberculatus]